ncbi:NADAR domain-containing protein [Aphelenchoides besseyi]|nr:NADAR domain-containing protein [Aphelenchoides besseyi]
MATQIVTKKLPHFVIVEVVKAKEKSNEWSFERLVAELEVILKSREEVERVEGTKTSETGRCFKCLSTQHGCRQCDKVCAVCQKPHHAAICFNRLKGKEGRADGVKVPATGTNATRQSKAVGTYQAFGQTESEGNELQEPIEVTKRVAYSSNSHKSVLPIAMIEVINLRTKQKSEIAALLDTGSNESYITTELRKELNLESNGKTTVRIDCFGGQTVANMDGEVVNLGIQTASGVLSLEALAVPQLMSATSVTRIRDGEEFTTYEQPKMLLGKKEVWSVLRIQQKTTAKGSRFIETAVGPVVVVGPGEQQTVQTYHNHRDTAEYDEYGTLKQMSSMWLQDGRAIVPFFTKIYPLSSFSVCPNGVWYKGNLFRTSEAAYQWAKAQFFGLSTIAREIWEAKTPNRVKEISNRKIHGHSRFRAYKWNAVKYQIMKDVCLKKFEQNFGLREALMSTHDAILVEASKDRDWGVETICRRAHGKMTISSLTQNRCAKMSVQILKE